MAGKVKIRIVSGLSIIATVLLTSVCTTISFLGFEKYNVLRNTTKDYISCEQAAKQLQEGSDILTKQVRLAAATGKQKYIDAYFKEAHVTKSREKALKHLEAINPDPKAISSLKEALSYSVKLMQTEYYSMRLVEESIHANPSTWTNEIKKVKLSNKDKQLSDTEKLNKAQNLVINLDYEQVKEEISDDVDATLNTLTKEILNRQQHASDTFSTVFKILIICISVFAIITLLICLIMRFWIVKPLINYNNSIRHGSIFPIHGAYELQVLAKTYNQVYQENEERGLLMKHQAEHDPMTELLNRGSFDRILNLYEKDQSHFALIIIDVDNFKHVNDTYGHAVGDIILKKVANLLTSAFRSVDYVCRIGGDEFAVIMVDITSEFAYTITNKITEVNHQLAITEENIPSISLSVGVAFTDRENPGEDLFKDADKALYYTKEHGRNGCTFYPVPEE